MSDILSDDDILETINVPMSSEPDLLRPQEFGWDDKTYSSEDDTDNDPDLQPIGDSMSESEEDGGNDIEASDVNLGKDIGDDISVLETVNSVNTSQTSTVDSEPLLLSAKYKKLKTKEEKLAMKREEEEKWTIYEGKQQQFLPVADANFLFNLPKSAKPIEYFNKYFNDDIIDLMVLETNRNACQVIARSRLSRSSRLRSWLPTNAAEMKKFIGLLIWMGLKSLPRISDYWSSKTIYKNSVGPCTMSRNRFQLILRLWHFNDNENHERDGRLSKILPLLSHLNNMFKIMKTPGQDVVIDESMVAFRGRLLFKQYIPKKSHKYGVKLFKICDITGYTYKVIVYMGKGTGTSDEMSLATSVVLELMEGYLDQGRTLYVDNFYTSMDLANTLLSRSTHMVGTVTSNRAWFPHQKVVSNTGKPLQKGEMSCLEYINGTVFTKWVDKREVRMVSTKHPPEFVETGKTSRKGDIVIKPAVVADYNKAKVGIDVSDQMSSYNSPVRRTMRWYHKVAEEMLLGTAMVNAWLAYRANIGTTKNKHSFTTFKEQVVYDLLTLQDEPVETVQRTGHHYLTESDIFVGVGKNKRRVRKFCKVCYQKCVETEGRQAAKKSKKVTTYCAICPNKPYLCKLCFQEKHK